MGFNKAITVNKSYTVVEIIIAVGLVIASIIIAVGIVTNQIPVIEGTQTLSVLYGGGLLIQLVYARNQSEQRKNKEEEDNN